MWRSPKTTSYEDEKELRDLIAGSPSLLPGVEEPVAAVTELGISGGGSADVVIVDAAGAITIVECKLRENPEIRMRVIGQVLWYAAALSELDYEELQRAFGKRGVPSLAAPFTEESEWEETAYRDAVSESLSSGAFRLVIAVDEITDALKRTVVYINRHTMDEIGLLAVELNYAEHEGVEMLIPDVFGEESAGKNSPGRRANLSRAELRELADQAGVVDLYDHAVKVVRKAGLQRKTTRSSIGFKGQLEKGGRTVISFVPGESSAEDGLRYQLYHERLAELTGLTEADVEALLPPEHETAFFPGSSRAGIQGFLMTREEIDQIAGALSKGD